MELVDDIPENTPGDQPKGFFARRKAKKAAREHAAAEARHAAALAQWQAERDACADSLDLVKNFTGSAHADGLVLKPGERCIATVTRAALIEDRAGKGEWKGASQGLSIPVGTIKGRSIRYRVGQTRGHYVQGEPVPTAIDTGTVFITDQRVVFRGAKQTRECLFTKIVGYDHSPDGMTTISVSNRQKATRIQYGAAISGWFALRFDLALALHQGQVPMLISELERDLAAIDAEKPRD